MAAVGGEELGEAGAELVPTGGAELHELVPGRLGEYELMAELDDASGFAGAQIQDLVADGDAAPAAELLSGEDPVR